MKPGEVYELFVVEIRKELGTQFSKEDILGFLTLFCKRHPKEFSFLSTHELLMSATGQFFARHCDETDSFISMMRGGDDD